MHRHVFNLLCFAVGVLISMSLLLPSSAYADDSPAITWSGDASPTAVCDAVGSTVTRLAYGSPTSFQCMASDGVVSAAMHSLTPSCPAGFEADFGKLVCVARGEFDDMSVNTLIALIGMSLALCVGIIAGLLS